MGASVGDIVYQCRSVAAGFIAEPDRAQLNRDVEALLSTYERVNADARFTVGTAPAPTRRTTVRAELRLARRQLAACEPRLARQLDVVDEGK